MKKVVLGLFCLLAGWSMVGCATDGRRGRTSSGPDSVGTTAVYRVRGLSAEVKARILALDPEHVTQADVRDLLSQTPAPRIINIHGGLLPIKTGMNSFARCLVGMGYPEESLRNPRNGSYTYGYYDRSDRIAATVAWYYERDGLRPMMVGHSQGGIQVVRVLHRLAGGYGPSLALWNPVTGSEEARHEITDPSTGMVRPVVGLKVSFATAALSGGLARLLPNVWNMNSRLRKIPDSVEEFTGFQKGMDPLGGDFLGYGSSNEYHATGSARVRNVRLRFTSLHSTIPYAKHLLRQQALREWIQAYHPDPGGGPANGSDPEVGRKGARVVWAAEVWYSIRKHWVLELQRLLRAQSAKHDDP